MGSSLSDELTRLYTGVGAYAGFYAKARAKLLNLDYYAEFLPDSGLLIDFGCGYGVVANYLSLRFPASQVIGVDLDHKRINAALRTVGGRRSINFLLQDVRTWALPHCTGAIMIDFLHHIPRQDQEVVLHRVFDGLGKGGVLLISEVDPTAKPFYRYWASYLSDRVLYPFSRSCFQRPDDWEGYLSYLGFSIETIKLRDPVFAGILYVCRKG